MAINIDKTSIVQPSQLGFNIQKLVRRSLGFQRESPRPQKLLMQLERRGSHMFEIAENTTRCEQIVNLGIERPLPFVGEMMDRETGNYRIKVSQCRQRILQMVRHNGH